ncbi:MAG: hypothetical protein OSB65_17465 [Roseibacillus sp.]|nr:hypothetical protein [Roseibacillus sp.]
MPPSPRRMCRPPFFLALSIALSPLEAQASLLWYSPMNGNANAVVGSNGVPTGSPAAAPDRDGNAGLWNEGLSARKVAAIHGLGKFQGLGLNHAAINTVVAFSSLAQSTTVGSVSWEYVDGLSGGNRTTGGTVGGEDAFIVLDGAAGRGIQISAGAACPCGSKTTSLL